MPFTIFCQEGDNCKPQVFARQDQAMLKLSLNHLRRNRKRFNGFFNVVGLIFHESGAVKNDNVHKNLHIHHSKKLLLVFKKYSAKSSAGRAAVEPRYYHGDGSKITLLPWPW